MQTGFMVLHKNLWLISGDEPLLKLVEMHLLKGDNKKLTKAFLVFLFSKVNMPVKDPVSSIKNSVPDCVSTSQPDVSNRAVKALLQLFLC